MAISRSVCFLLLLVLLTFTGGWFSYVALANEPGVKVEVAAEAPAPTTQAPAVAKPGGLREIKEFTLQACPKPGPPSAPMLPPVHPQRLVVRSQLPPNWFHVVSAAGHDHPTQAIRKDHVWEGGLSLLMKWALDVGCSADDCLVVDIGMNIGWYTALAAAHHRNVLAIEPNPAPLEFGNLTVEANRWQQRVRILQAGLSQDRAPLYVEPRLSESGSRRAERDARRGRQRVSSWRLDDLVDEKAKICFLKADCEGCEAEAFKSGEKLLASGRVKVLMLEFHHNDQARKALTTLQDLAPRPYRCALLPVGLGFGQDPRDPLNAASVWDALAAGMVQGCEAKRIEDLAPKRVPPGYYTDVWLFSDEVWSKLQAEPHYVQAQARIAAATKRCNYSQIQTDVGFCDLLCASFSSLADAQARCDGRPSCSKILQWSPTSFELRGGWPSAGGVKGYVKRC